MRNILMLGLVSLLMLTSCNKKSTQTPIDSKAQNQSMQTDSHTSRIPYQELNNFFVLNTIDNTQVECKKITTQKEFDAVFGQARTMSKESIASVVDFDKSFVLAIIAQPSFKQTFIEILSVKQKNQVLELIYSIENQSEQRSYQTHDFKAIVIDKKYDMDVKFIAE